jgi:hypothetical protein
MKNSLTGLKLSKNSNLPYWSDADFSMHELLECLLEQTGPASVRISSFSITEIAVRAFSNLQERGLITGLKCLFDFSVKQHRLGLLFFASNVLTHISLCKCHAKLILIKNDEWRVAVVGSANFNVNDKKEVGIISSVESIFNMFSKKYDDWFSEAMIIDRDGL